MQPILLYFPNEDGRTVELQKVVQEVVHSRSFTLLHDSTALEYFLHHSVTTPSIIFLCLGSREDLIQILTLKDMLMLSQIMMVLPNQAPDMIAMAHRLRPRFVAYIDDDLSLITDVLSRLIQDLVSSHGNCSVLDDENICSASG